MRHEADSQTPSSRAPAIQGRERAAPLRLYALLLALYPSAFRERHAAEMWQTCRDLAEETGAQGIVAGARFWLAIYADTLAGALHERWDLMRGTVWVWLVMGATLLAVVVSFAASLNLYLLEDGNSLTAAAYGASPLLRFSYDGAYIAGLVAGVAGVAVVVSALAPARTALWVAIGLAALVTLGAFGGLVVRRPPVGLALIGVFATLAALCLLVGWAVRRALASRASGRMATLVSACVGAGVALLAEAAALITHTLALNPVSHALYMQARIGDTPYNAALIGMVAQALLVGLCALLLAATLWSNRSGRRGGAPAAG
jgi:hypothetical protein